VEKSIRNLGYFSKVKCW